MNVNEIANLIMQAFFEYNSKVDHALDQRWLLQFSTKLNPKEKDLLQNAIDLLEKEGLVKIENRSGRACMALTQKGFESIYDTDKGVIISKIKRDLMSQFAKMNSRVGHILPDRWFMMVYCRTLNPFEQTCLDEAVNELITDGLAEGKNGGLALTQKGYDFIY